MWPCFSKGHIIFSAVGISGPLCIHLIDNDPFGLDQIGGGNHLFNAPETMSLTGWARRWKMEDMFTLGTIAYCSVLCSQVNELSRRHNLSGVNYLRFARVIVQYITAVQLRSERGEPLSERCGLSSPSIAFFHRCSSDYPALSAPSINIFIPCRYLGYSSWCSLLHINEASLHNPNTDFPPRYDQIYISP